MDDGGSKNAVVIPMQALHLNGFLKVSAPTMDREVVLDALEQNIRKEKPRWLIRNEQRITFAGGPFRRVDSLNQLLAISCGEISVGVDAGVTEVHYRARLGGLLIGAAIPSSVLGIIVLLSGSIVPGVAVWSLAFGFIFLVGFLQVRSRFPVFLERSIPKSGQNQLPTPSRGRTETPPSVTKGGTDGVVS